MRRRRRRNNRNEEEEEGKTIEMRRNKKHWGGKIIKIVEKGIKKLRRAIKLKRERGK